MATRSAAWFSVPALAGALSALILPGASSTTAAGAALLAVGALALLAGHGWGLTVSVPSHVTVAGQLWPDLALHSPGTSFHVAVILVVLVTALPALVLSTITVPRMARDVLGERQTRAHTVFAVAASTGLVAALVVPALL